MSLESILEQASKNNIELLKYHARRIVDFLNDFTGSELFEQEIESLELPYFIPLKILPKLNSDLIFFINKVRKNKLLTHNHVNAFLATIPPDDFPEREKLLIIQARLLLVAHELSNKKGYTNFIIRALREYRLMINKSQWPWLNELPDFSLPIDDLINELESVRELLPAVPKRRTLAFVSLLIKYKKNKQVYTSRTKKCRTKTIKNTNNKFETSDSQLIFDEDEAIYKEFLPEPLQIGQSSIDHKERIADQFTTKNFYQFNLVVPDEVKQSLSLQLTASKAAANHIQRREKILISNFSFLTQHEIRILIAYCLQHINKSAHYCILLVMLFTGKNLEDAIEAIVQVRMSNNPPFHEHAVFLFEPDLPKHEVAPDIEGILKRSTGLVIQALPKEIRYSIKYFQNQFYASKSLAEEIKKTIKELNKKNTINLTLGRISNYLMCYLNNKGVDSTEITLILGRGLRQESGTYYYQVKTDRLLAIHQKYVNNLMALNGHDITKIETSDTKTIGSQLIIKKETIANLFILITKQLEKFRAGGWNYIEEFHNLYVIYCIELLNLATGHRPVKHPYEDSHKFDLVARTLFISDKEERSELAARVIVLPSIAIEQIQLYQQHLVKIESELANISSKTSETIKYALTGAGPLFFFINDSQVEPVIPSNLSARLECIWPFPLNWHRHFMRTWLRKNGFSGQWVHAWMGHLSMGSAGFSRYSGLAIQDLRIMAASIQNLLTKELSIKTIKPWGNHNEQK